MTDDDLLRRLQELLRQSRRIESELVAHIAEVDRRRLYAREATSSMHAYCTEVLHLSEAEAYFRIAVARASRQHPVLLTMLADGRLHLTGIAKLAPHLTRENRDRLLARATHKPKREIEGLVAELAPRPDVPAKIRKLPQPRAAQTPTVELVPDVVVGSPEALPELVPDAVASPPPRRPAVVEPLGPDRFAVKFTASAVLREKLERLQALMPDADLAGIIEQAVTEKLERIEARRFANTKTPRKSLAETDTTPSSRYLPAAVRRAVYERDGGRCRYVDPKGKRCTARRRLEFHHRQPYGLHGDHSLDNVELACKTHNTFLAERDYGEEKMARYRRTRDSMFPPPKQMTNP